MNPIVDGEPAGSSLKEGYFSVVSLDNYRISVPQGKINRRHLYIDPKHKRTKHCTTDSTECRHEFHIPVSERTAKTLPSDVGNIAAALNYQVHISEAAVDYCNLIYHTLIGSRKEGPKDKSQDLQESKQPLSQIPKKEESKQSLGQIQKKADEINLSQREIDQIASKIGVIVTGNISVPSAEEISEGIRVPTAVEITQEIGELSLNEFTKSDLVNRISKLIRDKPVRNIPPVNVPTASEIASQIQIPPIKYPTAQEIANLIKIPEIDYSRIAKEVASQIKIPKGQNIDIDRLAQQVADRVPKCDPSEIAAKITLPEIPSAEQIASKIHIAVPTAEEIANKVIETHPDIVNPPTLEPVPVPTEEYKSRFDNIDTKLAKILKGMYGENFE